MPAVTKYLHPLYCSCGKKMSPYTFFDVLKMYHDFYMM